jgi:hypothetical protein
MVPTLEFGVVPGPALLRPKVSAVVGLGCNARSDYRAKVNGNRKFASSSSNAASFTITKQSV